MTAALLPVVAAKIRMACFWKDNCVLRRGMTLQQWSTLSRLSPSVLMPFADPS
jgi:hypothetical protein